MEPKTSAAAAATALPVVAAYPVLGEYMVIVLGALFGAFVALSRLPPVEGRGRWFAARFVLSGIAFASVLTGGLASWLSARTGVEFYRLLAPVAFFIAWLGDDWSRMKEMVFDRFGKKS